MEQTYFLEIIPLLDKGGKARRLGWPEGKYITKAKYKIEVEGVPGVKTAVHPANEILLVDPTKADKKLNRPAGQNILGYQPNENEKTSMDWVLIEEESEKEEIPFEDPDGFSPGQKVKMISGDEVEIVATSEEKITFKSETTGEVTIERAIFISRVAKETT